MRRQGSMISSAVWGKADYARLDAGFAVAIEVACDWRSFWAVAVVRDGRYTVLACCAVLARYTVLACCANLAICSHVWVLSRSRRSGCRGIVRHIASRVAVLTAAVGVTGVWLEVGVMRCRGSHLQEVLDLVHGADVTLSWRGAGMVRTRSLEGLAARG
jgi:hypothetical protein